MVLIEAEGDTADAKYQRCSPSAKKIDARKNRTTAPRGVQGLLCTQTCVVGTSAASAFPRLPPGIEAITAMFLHWCATKWEVRGRTAAPRLHWLPRSLKLDSTTTLQKQMETRHVESMAVPEQTSRGPLHLVVLSFFKSSQTEKKNPFCCDTENLQGAPMRPYFFLIHKDKDAMIKSHIFTQTRPAASHPELTGLHRNTSSLTSFW